MASNPLIASEFTNLGSAIIVRLRGELDRLTAPYLDRVLAEARRSGKDVIVGLSGLTYLDMGGVKLLEAAAQQSRDQGRGFVLAESPPPVRRILEVFGFHQVVPMLESIRDAMSYLHVEGTAVDPAMVDGTTLDPAEPPR